jgi:hypothetical protein
MKNNDSTKIGRGTRDFYKIAFGNSRYHRSLDTLGF